MFPLSDQEPIQKIPDSPGPLWQFQRPILKGWSKITIYTDDLLAYSKTYKEHFVNLKISLSMCHEVTNFDLPTK